MADNRRALLPARTTMSTASPTSTPATAAEWQAWVARFAALMQAAPDPQPPSPAAHAGQRCLVFAPHPDDECIVGALPLRLRQESGWQVANVAVTLGSKPERRAARLAELQAACALLGFELLLPGGQGLERVREDTPTAEPALWAAQRHTLAELIRTQDPALLLIPHAGDGNGTHRAVHRLVTEAMAEARYTGLLAQTEFWAPLQRPNCMVQTGEADTARLIQALASHAGEVARNPYHLRLPAWLADNVRRGGELIGGAGSEPPRYAFATLYQLSRWSAGAWQQDLTPMFCGAEQALSL